MACSCSCHQLPQRPAIVETPDEEAARLQRGIEYPKRKAVEFVKSDDNSLAQKGKEKEHKKTSGEPELTCDNEDCFKREGVCTPRCVCACHKQCVQCKVQIKEGSLCESCKQRMLADTRVQHEIPFDESEHMKRVKEWCDKQNVELESHIQRVLKWAHEMENGESNGYKLHDLFVGQQGSGVVVSENNTITVEREPPKRNCLNPIIGEVIGAAVDKTQCDLTVANQGFFESLLGRRRLTEAGTNVVSMEDLTSDSTPPPH